jgi:ABC-type glycerol-3-phosphate transport system permease component
MEILKNKSRSKKNKEHNSVLIHILLLIFVIPHISIFCYWLFRSMQKWGGKTGSIRDTPGGLANYLIVLKNPSIANMLKNSVIITLSSIFILIIVTSLGGFAFSKLNFPGKNKIYSFILLGLILSPGLILAPTFILIKYMGLFNTHISLILPLTSLQIAFGLLIMKNFIDDIPDSLIDAAKIDGASSFKTWAYIIFPMSLPPIIVVGLLGFLLFWGDYLLPITLITKSEMAVATMAPSLFTGQYGSNIPLVFGGGFIISLPTMIVFLVFQRFLVEGMRGAVKE